MVYFFTWNLFLSNPLSYLFKLLQYKKVGSALILSHTAYIEAKAAHSPSTMTMNLVRSSFSDRRLRKSTYAGQKRGSEAKPSLKKYRKMQDIQGKHFTLHSWRLFSICELLHDLGLVCFRLREKPISLLQPVPIWSGCEFLHGQERGPCESETGQFNFMDTNLLGRRPFMQPFCSYFSHKASGTVNTFE